MALGLVQANIDGTALTVRTRRTDPVGAVLHTDDPLARRDRAATVRPGDRRWFRFPQDTVPLWRLYCNSGRA